MTDIHDYTHAATLQARYDEARFGDDTPISDDALDAAALGELASRLGLDWQEAADALECVTSDSDEADAAAEAVKAWSDRELLLTMAGLMIKRRAELDGVMMRAALLRKTARDVMEPVA